MDPSCYHLAVDEIKVVRLKGESMSGCRQQLFIDPGVKQPTSRSSRQPGAPCCLVGFLVSYAGSHRCPGPVHDNPSVNDL